MSWKESYACHILKRRLESMQTKLYGKWSQGKVKLLQAFRYQEYNHKKNMIRVFRSFTPLQVYPLTPLWVHLQKKSKLASTFTNSHPPSPVCLQPHQFAPTFTSLPPTSPIPPHLHQFALAFTKLPSLSRVRPHLHQFASTFTNSTPPSSSCLHLNQFSPSFTNLPPPSPFCLHLHQFAPTFTKLPPPSPVSPYLLQFGPQMFKLFTSEGKVPIGGKTCNGEKPPQTITSGSNNEQVWVLQGWCYRE